MSNVGMERRGNEKCKESGRGINKKRERVERDGEGGNRRGIEREGENGDTKK